MAMAETEPALLAARGRHGKSASPQFVALGAFTAHFTPEQRLDSRYNCYWYGKARPTRLAALIKSIIGIDTRYVVLAGPQDSRYYGTPKGAKQAGYRRAGGVQLLADFNKFTCTSFRVERTDGKVFRWYSLDERCWQGKFSVDGPLTVPVRDNMSERFADASLSGSELAQFAAAVALFDTHREQILGDDRMDESA